MADTEEITDTPDKYRGPPPRKDLIPSPSKERDWKGNDWFCDMSTENGTQNGMQNGVQNGGTNNGITDERGSVSPTTDVGMPGLSGEYVDPHLKAHRDYESNYAKLALQGGHKDLLSMENQDKTVPVPDDIGRRQKGCENLSEYNKIALQGGHPNLLFIEDCKDGKDVSVKHTTPVKSPSNRSTQAAGAPSQSEPNRTTGDWYSRKSIENNNTPSPIKVTSPTSKSTAQNQRSRGNGNVIVPGSRSEEAPRVGKKRFDCQSQRQEAPFATYY